MYDEIHLILHRIKWTHHLLHHGEVNMHMCIYALLHCTMSSVHTLDKIVQFLILNCHYLSFVTFAFQSDFYQYHHKWHKFGGAWRWLFIERFYFLINQIFSMEVFLFEIEFRCIDTSVLNGISSYLICLASITIDCLLFIVLNRPQNLCATLPLLLFDFFAL